MQASILEGLEPRLMLAATSLQGLAEPTDARPLQQQRQHAARAKRAASRLVVTGGSIAEGNPGQVRKLTFTVKRQGSVAAAASVRYRAVSSGEFAQATAGADFAGKSGTLNFAPGVKQLKITVNVFGDNNPEFDETVRLELSKARGAAIKTASTLGTIVDDDAGKDVDVSITSDTFNPDPGENYPPTLLPVTLTFANSGTHASAATRVQFFMGNFDDFDNLQGYVDIGSPINVPSVAPGGTVTQNYVLDFNQAFVFNDSWAAFARILIEDTSMTNNTRFLGFIQIRSNNT